MARRRYGHAANNSHRSAWKCHTKRAERVEEKEPNKDWTVEIRFPGKEGLAGYKPTMIAWLVVDGKRPAISGRR